jgi:beta-glucanase (GH16 family)
MPEVVSRAVSTRPAAVVLAAALAVAGGCASDPANDRVPTAPGPSIAIEPWADEFDGPAGAPPDASHWTFDLGNNRGWGNGELQTYTASGTNVHLDGEGHLVIQVESTDGGYTSARLKTQGLRLAQFGRFEARLRVPVGQGVWPALWMLGGSFDGSNWPACGEIDVMELRGSQPSVVHATVHGPQYSGGGGISGSYRLPEGTSFADDFHTFAVEWAPSSIRFLVDGSVHHTVTPRQLPPGAPWVFDQRFFVLLNVAVGGNFVGPPDASTRFPQQMIVDYVRYVP